MASGRDGKGPRNQSASGRETSEIQQIQARKLLYSYEVLFSTSPGRTTAISHIITTPPGHTVQSTNRLVPWKCWEIISQEVEDTLPLDVIEPSMSAQRNPIVLVLKPDGSIRFCIDFRAVNKVAECDAYPMPRTGVLLSRLGEARYISALDLTKGLFHFKVIPFELYRAAATFQRLMDTMLSTCEDFMLAYLDDILLYSRTWEQHLSHLSCVFQLLIKAGLRVNPKKSKVEFTQLEYLGYTIGEGTVKPQARKISAIQNAPRPTTKKQLRQFL